MKKFKVSNKDENKVKIEYKVYYKYILQKRRKLSNFKQICKWKNKEFFKIIAHEELVITEDNKVAYTINMLDTWQF